MAAPTKLLLLLLFLLELASAAPSPAPAPSPASAAPSFDELLARMDTCLGRSPPAAHRGYHVWDGAKGHAEVGNMMVGATNAFLDALLSGRHLVYARRPEGSGSGSGSGNQASGSPPVDLNVYGGSDEALVRLTSLLPTRIPAAPAHCDPSDPSMLVTMPDGSRDQARRWPTPASASASASASGNVASDPRARRTFHYRYSDCTHSGWEAMRAETLEVRTCVRVHARALVAYLLVRT